MLNYMVTCRYTDKKPHDNILETPITAQLVNKSEVLGGTITNKLAKKIGLLDDLTEASTSSLSLASVADGSVFTDFGGTLAKFADNAIAKAADTGALSAFMADPIGKGKTFCPFVR